MANYVLSCCSTADLSKEHFEQRDIKYICFHYFIDGEEHLDDLGQSMPFDVFYDRISKGADTRTSQVNIAEYVDFFSAFAQQGLSPAVSILPVMPPSLSRSAIRSGKFILWTPWVLPPAMAC